MSAQAAVCIVTKVMSNFPVSSQCVQAFAMRSKLEASMQRYASGRSQAGPPQSASHPPEHLHRAFHITLEPEGIDELADVPSALHSYFQSLVLSQQGRLDHSRSALPDTDHTLRLPPPTPTPSLRLPPFLCGLRAITVGLPRQPQVCPFHYCLRALSTHCTFACVLRQCSACVL